MGPSQNPMAVYSRARRAEFVASGRCGYCGQLRNKYRWLCDGCAFDHRDRQRAKSMESRIAATWTSTIASIIEQGGLR